LTRSYLELVERIRGEVPDLDRVVRRALQNWSRGAAVPNEQDVYLESVALNLHSFYSGLERLFELMASRANGRYCELP
jgi:hypothetical protein